MREQRNRTYSVVKSLVLLQAAGAAVLSFMHIVEVGQRYGLGWQAWVAPFLIDGFALLGTIGRSASFAESTRSTGLKLMIGAGVVSLACNVEAGVNLGQRIFGVLVVAGFLTAEWYSQRLLPAPLPSAVVDDETFAKRSAAARKGVETRRKNKAVAKRKPRGKSAASSEIDALEAAYVLPDAPVSPAATP